MSDELQLQMGDFTPGCAAAVVAVCAMVTLIFIFGSCETETIKQCQAACEKKAGSMASWSKQAGCVCGEKR